MSSTEQDLEKKPLKSSLKPGRKLTTRSDNNISSGQLGSGGRSGGMRSQSRAGEDEDGWEEELEKERKSLPLVPFPTGEEEANYICSSLLVRKWILLGLFLQTMCIMAALTLWFFTYYVWPMGFAIEFQGEPRFLRNRFVILALGIEPLYNLILLFIVVCSGAKIKYIVRIYYLFTPWLLILTFILGIYSLIFIGNFTKSDLEKNLLSSLVNYVEDLNIERESSHHPHIISGGEEETSKPDWDKLQTYFQCCGVNGQNDWKREYVEDSQKEEWIVPISCCTLKGGIASNCTRSPAKGNVWPKGCLDYTFDRFNLVGVSATVICFTTILVTVFCVFAAAQFYSTLRRGDGTNYIMSLRTFSKEFFCFPCLCCLGRRKGGKVKPIGTLPTSTSNNPDLLDGDERTV